MTSLKLALAVALLAVLCYFLYQADQHTPRVVDVPCLNNTNR